MIPGGVIQRGNEHGAVTDEGKVLVITHDVLPDSKKMRQLDLAGNYLKVSAPSPKASIKTPKKQKTQDTDPNAPKPARAAYLQYVDIRIPEQMLQDEALTRFEAKKIALSEWKTLEDKTVYQTLAETDKERFDAEMADYKPDGEKMIE